MGAWHSLGYNIREGPSPFLAKLFPCFIIDLLCKIQKQLLMSLKMCNCGEDIGQSPFKGST